MNQKTRKTKRAMVLLLSLAMILTSVFSMPLSYAADEKEDPLPDSMQVGVGGVVDEGADVELIKNKVSDETMYTPLYLLKHGNSEYVDTTKINLNALAQPVAIARGIATYNYGKQKEWKYTANSIASMYYEVPVYDLDKESDYYVAIPNVALNSKEIGTYDFVLGYNNDYGETINDYVYDDDIVYIAVNTFWEELEICLPELPMDKHWHMAVNTFDKEPVNKDKKQVFDRVTMYPRSVRVFYV